MSVTIFIMNGQSGARLWTPVLYRFVRHLLDYKMYYNGGIKIDHVWIKPTLNFISVRCGAWNRIEKYFGYTFL